MTDTTHEIPVLYSFRRCPYCMRAHMALKYCGLRIELREVLLSSLPPEVLAVSPDATVPVLVLDNNHSMDESWEIVKWAIKQNDPDHLIGIDQQYLLDAEILIETNDYSFKADLDHYKYADRYPEHSKEYYREHCEEFLTELEDMLGEKMFLLADQMTIADIAISPFIRQFSMVDHEWFQQSPYPEVQRWLQTMLSNTLFKAALLKHTVWLPGADTVYV